MKNLTNNYGVSSNIKGATIFIGVIIICLGFAIASPPGKSLINEYSIYCYIIGGLILLAGIWPQLLKPLR